MIVHRVKEKNIKYKLRKGRRIKSVKDLPRSLNDEEVAQLEEEAEVSRLGSYQEGKARLLKAILMSQQAM